MPFINIKGVRYHYTTQYPSVNTSATTLLFIHGAGGSHRHWNYQMSGLRNNFNCLAVDLPGHCLSEGHPQDNIFAYREFIKEFTEELLDKPFFLCGHSMGGAITLDFARCYPERLLGQVLVGSGSRLRVLPTILDTFGSGAHFTDLIHYAYGTKATKSLKEIALQEILNTPPYVFYADFMACDAFDISTHLSSIKVPAMVITAEEDKLTPPKYGKFLADKIPYTSHISIAYAGHMMMLEQPEKVNLAIKNFIHERGKTNACQV